MPPNSDSVPLIACYYFGSMFIISLATAGTVLTLNIHKKGNEGKPVSELVQKIFFGFIAKVLFININIKNRKNKSRIVPSRAKYISIFRNSLKEIKLCNNTDKNDLFSVENFLLTEVKTNEIKPNKTCCNNNNDSDYLSNRLLIRESPLMNGKKSNCRQKSKSSREFNNLLSNNEEDLSITTMSSDDKKDGTNKVNLILKPRDMEPRTSLNQDFYSDQKKLIKMLKELNYNLENYELKELISDYKEEIKIQWTQLAYVIDALMGYAFVISSFFLVFFLIYKIPNARFY